MYSEKIIIIPFTFAKVYCVLGTVLGQSLALRVQHVCRGDRCYLELISRHCTLKITIDMLGHPEEGENISHWEDWERLPGWGIPRTQYSVPSISKSVDGNCQNLTANIAALTSPHCLMAGLCWLWKTGRQSPGKPYLRDVHYLVNSTLSKVWPSSLETWFSSVKETELVLSKFSGTALKTKMSVSSKCCPRACGAHT